MSKIIITLSILVLLSLIVIQAIDERNSKQKPKEKFLEAEFSKSLDTAKFLATYCEIDNSIVFPAKPYHGELPSQDCEMFSFFDSAASEPHFEVFYTNVYSWPPKIIQRVKRIPNYFSVYLPKDTAVCNPIQRAFNHALVRASIGGPDQKICIRNRDSSIFIWELPSPIDYNFGPYDRRGFLIKIDKTGSNIMSLHVLDEIRNVYTRNKEYLTLGFPNDYPTTYSLLLGLYYSRLFKKVELHTTQTETLLWRDKRDSLIAIHNYKL